MDSANIFVFLDDVQYHKNDFQNRNKIRTSEGSIWLTVPVNSTISSNLRDITIDNTSNWTQKHMRSIQLNYSKSEYFNKYWNMIESFYAKKFDLLIDLNVFIIKQLAEKFKIKPKIVFSSELGISGKGSDRILNICKNLSCDTYLSGASGKNYLNLEDFSKNNIIVQFQNYQHPMYRQAYEPFLPKMSSIDLLFNEGDNSYNILKNSLNF